MLSLGEFGLSFWLLYFPLVYRPLREGNSPDHHMAITYHQLLSQVCRCANVLKQMGEKFRPDKVMSMQICL